MSFPHRVIPVFGSGRAYADLNFAGGSFGVNGGIVNDITLLTGYTFTGASLRMGYDSTGKLTYGPNNLNVRSQEFDNASWAKSGSGAASAPVITADQALAPDGTMTADLAVFTLNGGTASGDISTIQQTVSSVGPTVQSLWARTSDGSTKVFSYVGPGGSVVGQVTITPTWQRISLAEPNAGTASQRLRLRGSAIGEGTATSASIYIWGAQLEAVTYQTTPSTYYPTTSAAYYGARLVYDPVTLASQGILVEEARTNLLTYSEQIDNAAWTKTGCTITADAVTSPAGTTTMDKIVASSGTNIKRVQQNVSLTNAVAYCNSAFFKQGEWRYAFMYGGGSSIPADEVILDLQTGVIVKNTNNRGTVQNVGGGIYRLSYQFTATATGADAVRTGVTTSDTSVTSTGDGVSGAYCWGNQLEAGTGASSYIPTTSASVTRAADVPYTAGLATLPEFTVVAEGIPNSPSVMPSTQTLAAYDDGTTTNRAYAFRPGTGTANIETSTGYAYTGAAWPQGASRKVAFTSRAGAQTGAFNGTLATPGTSAQPASLSSLSIGIRSDRSTLQWNGTIARIRIYNRALTDAQLQALST